MKRLLGFLVAASLCLPTASSAWWKSIQQVGVVPSFNPGTIAGIWGWYKADAGVFADTAGTVPITNGTGVGLWKEQSLGGGPNLPQATSGNRPVWSSSGLGHLGFTSASDQNLTTASGAVSFGGARSTLTEFLAIQVSSSSPGNARILSYAAPGANDYNAGSLEFNQDSGVNITWSGPASASSSFVPYTSLTTIYVALVLDGTNVTMYYSGPGAGSWTTASSGAIAQTNNVNDSGTLGVGSFINSSGVVGTGASLQGTIYEVAIVKGNATTSLSNMYTYFNSRWP